MNYKKEETSRLTIKTKYDSLYRIVLTLSRQCNYNCSFCPQSKVSDEYRSGFLSIKTVETIINNLDNKFNGVFSLSGFGEPTLNPDFFTIIEKLKNETECKIDVISNGSDINKLLECKADSIHISAYSKKLEEILVKKTERDKRISVLPKYKQENFNNRGGNLYSSLIKHINCCNVLLMKLSIDYNGDILKCCSDWIKKDILDNVYNNSIWDIWFNKTKADKLNMINGNRDKIKICQDCNAAGDLYGNQFKQFWEEYYKVNQSSDYN